MKFVVGAIILIAVLGVGYLQWPRTQVDRSQPSAEQGTALADVVVPEELSAEAQIGKRGFEAKCAVCHGVNGAGKLP